MDQHRAVDQEPSRSRRKQPHRAPPPYWFTTCFPFPVDVGLPRGPGTLLLPEDCTPGHWRAAKVATDVRTALTALVAMGEFDVWRFLVYTNDLPPKYLTYLRGRRLLRDANVEVLRRAIRERAELLARLLSPDEPSDVPARSAPSYGSVLEVARSLKAPLLESDWLYVKDRNIVKWEWPATEPDWQRFKAQSEWWERVRKDHRERFGRGFCQCHTVQAMYDNREPGPPNERTLFDRGGKRLDNGPW